MNKNDLYLITNNLKLLYGSFDEEIIEQKLSCKYISDTNYVLEIGGNMGRNAMVISSILNNDTNLVTMEPNIDFYKKLIENRDINNKKFYIENSALSSNKLVFNGSLTFDINSLDEKYPLSKEHLKNNKNNFRECNIITFEELEQKYNIKFDTLVIDCEGAFYYIIKDLPDILSNISLIIMENDYENKYHYDYIKTILLEKKFICIESIPLLGNQWNPPCKDNFYEVWKLI